MNNTVYQRFIKRFEEVTDLPPQTLGPLTPVYKILVRRLKTMPFPWFIAVSCIAIFTLYLLIGSTITLMVSVLQRGF